MVSYTEFFKDNQIAILYTTIFVLVALLFIMVGRYTVPRCDAPPPVPPMCSLAELLEAKQQQVQQQIQQTQPSQ